MPVCLPPAYSPFATTSFAPRVGWHDGLVSAFSPTVPTRFASYFCAARMLNIHLPEDRKKCLHKWELFLHTTPHQSITSITPPIPGIVDIGNINRRFLRLYRNAFHFNFLFKAPPRSKPEQDGMNPSSLGNFTIRSRRIHSVPAQGQGIRQPWIPNNASLRIPMRPLSVHRWLSSLIRFST